MILANKTLIKIESHLHIYQVCFKYKLIQNTHLIIIDGIYVYICRLPTKLVRQIHENMKNGRGNK